MLCHSKKIHTSAGCCHYSFCSFIYLQFCNKHVSTPCTSKKLRKNRPCLHKGSFINYVDKQGERRELPNVNNTKYIRLIPFENTYCQIKFWNQSKVCALAENKHDQYRFVQKITKIT